MSRGECFRCGERGHWAADCDKPKDYRKPPKCGYCGERGHTKRTCPKRHADETAKRHADAQAEAQARERAVALYDDALSWKSCGIALFTPEDDTTRLNIRPKGFGPGEGGCNGARQVRMSDMYLPCGCCETKDLIAHALRIDTHLRMWPGVPFADDWYTAVWTVTDLTHKAAQSLFPNTTDLRKDFQSAEERGSFLRAWAGLHPRARLALSAKARGLHNFATFDYFLQSGRNDPQEYVSTGGYAKGVPLFDILSEWVPDIVRGEQRIDLRDLIFVREEALILSFKQHRGHDGDPFALFIDLRNEHGEALLDAMDEAEAEGVMCEYVVRIDCNGEPQTLCKHCAQKKFLRSSADFCKGLVYHDLTRKAGSDEVHCKRCMRTIDPSAPNPGFLGLCNAMVDRTTYLWNNDGRTKPDTRALRHARILRVEDWAGFKTDKDKGEVAHSLKRRKAQQEAWSQGRSVARGNGA